MGIPILLCTTFTLNSACANAIFDTLTMHHPVLITVFFWYLEQACCKNHCKSRLPRPLKPTATINIQQQLYANSRAKITATLLRRFRDFMRRLKGCAECFRNAAIEQVLLAQQVERTKKNNKKRTARTVLIVCNLLYCISRNVHSMILSE